MLAVAAAGLIPLMNRNNASAATASDVALHCRDGSPLLEKCDFIQRTETVTNGNSFRVSDIQNNCDGTEPDPFSFDVNVRSQAEARIESGAFLNVNGSVGLEGVFQATATAASKRFKITGFREDSSVSFKVKADIEPNTRAAIYFRPEVLQDGGYLEATYKEAEADGTKVFFFPERDADTVLVRFPLANDNGDPKGFYWVRSMQCLSNSRLVIPNFNTADFGELTGFGVVDTPISVG
ncbi:hypothetical protein [Micromonospora sp. KC213]|uniref:hypothetical protein n=1 Tax=Micromonospora sp. KC213 TaxID=2530378 RepID=UPI0010F330C2|nr:hypothetical protein [Micromonospora sp. KC213]TDC31954.1 hypothetical protein E1166_27300 [Micromonospora sp. KC213]